MVDLLTLSNVGVLVVITELESLVDTGGGTRRDIGAENTYSSFKRRKNQG
jgi:hypothetical protein